MTDEDDAFLDEIFDAAQRADGTVSDALMDRVLADLALVPIAPPKETLWSGLMTAIGGWPAMGGIAMAGVIGVCVGFAPPAPVETLAADILGTTTSVSFLGDFDDLFEAELTDG